MTPDGVGIENPAFDVTPAKYVAAIITERGIARAPYQESLRELIASEIPTPSLPLHAASENSLTGPETKA